MVPNPRAAAMARILLSAGAVCLAAAGLAGCASPVGVLEPTSALAPGATRLDILVATTRAPAPDRGVFFSGERGAASYAGFAVSIPPDGRREIGQVQWPQRLPPDPATEFATLEATPIEAADVDGWLRRHARSRRALVFVHGFNTRFESALFSFAQIFHDSGAVAAPVLFTWPSRGSVLNYIYDRESAAFSRDALEKLLHRLALDRNIDEVQLLAHSMGAWLAMESLRQMAIRDGRVSAKIGSVILASPDLDVDVFRSQLKSLGPQRPDFTVFLSREDRALQLSRGLGGNVERLGAVDPNEKPWIAEKGVEVVDLSGAGGGSALRHSKFAQNPDVVRFLGEELINAPARERNIEFGERVEILTRGIAQGVTGAAGLAIGAPMAVVDPR